MTNKLQAAKDLIDRARELMDDSTVLLALATDLCIASKQILHKNQSFGEHKQRPFIFHPWDDHPSDHPSTSTE